MCVREDTYITCLFVKDKLVPPTSRTFLPSRNYYESIWWCQRAFNQKPWQVYYDLVLPIWYHKPTMKRGYVWRSTKSSLTLFMPENKLSMLRDRYPLSPPPRHTWLFSTLLAKSFTSLEIDGLWGFVPLSLPYQKRCLRLEYFCVFCFVFSLLYNTTLVPCGTAKWFYMKDVYPARGTDFWRGRVRVVQLLQMRCDHKLPAFAITQRM